MTLRERLNRIITQQGIPKAEIARRLCISENHVYILTGNSRAGAAQNKAISPSPAKLIEPEFGYDADWVLHG